MNPFLEDLARRGYEIEDRTESIWFARHDDLPAMFVVEGSGGFLLRAYFGGVQSGRRESPLQLLNRLNREAVASRFFLDDDDDLVVEAWHSAAYDADGFGTFLDRWFRDIGTMLDAHRAAERTFDA
jgi:hypothetical protein